MKQLNYDQFLCLTLLYAANVGEGFTAEEKTLIIGHVGNETYDQVYDVFDNMSDFEALETIMTHKGIHYPTPDRKKEVLSRIKEIFKIDDNYDVVEKEIFHFLKNLL